MATSTEVGVQGSFTQTGYDLLTMRDWERLAREAEFKSSKMASLCLISERQLQRLFKKKIKRTPSEWLRQLQCRLARDLICKGYSNKAAAAELKFASTAHFCRVFKNCFGASPQIFAETQRASSAACKLTQSSWEVLRKSG